MMYTPTFLLLLVVGVTDAFAPSIKSRTASVVALAASSSDSGGLDLSDNTWKPTEGQMHATDVGDYFPDDYEDELEFTDGIKGISGLSHPKAGGGNRGPDLPGMDVLNDDLIDHVLGSGIQQVESIPEGMEFIPSSVPDGEIQMRVPIVSGGACQREATTESSPLLFALTVLACLLACSFSIISHLSPLPGEQHILEIKVSLSYQCIILYHFLSLSLSLGRVVIASDKLTKHCRFIFLNSPYYAKS